MKKYTFNLTYIKDNDVEVISKIMKMIGSINGLKLDSMCIEDIPDPIIAPLGQTIDFKG